MQKREHLLETPLPDISMTSRVIETGEQKQSSLPRGSVLSLKTAQMLLQQARALDDVAEVKRLIAKAEDEVSSLIKRCEMRMRTSEQVD